MDTYYNFAKEKNVSKKARNKYSEPLIMLVQRGLSFHLVFVILISKFPMAFILFSPARLLPTLPSAHAGISPVFAHFLVLFPSPGMPSSFDLVTH